MDFSNFLPLLAVIRADLGSDWEFYKEFLESVIDSAGRSEDTSAWYEQVETLVGDQSGLRFSHEGICFLLRGLEKKAREGMMPPKSKSHSPRPFPTSPARVSASDLVSFQSRPAASKSGDIAECTPLPLTDSNMSAPPPPKISTSKQPTSQANITLPDADIIILGSSQSAAISSGDFHPALFTDATFRRDINEYFYPPKDAQPTAPDTRKVIPPVRDGSQYAPPYYAKDNDLTVWKKRIEEGTGVKVSMDAKAASGDSKKNTLPTPATRKESSSSELPQK
ncbi:hypothetical protein NX059_009039 [Plenodomus lindquistii]|nr:hypothetical protein NX059_009039 [Plenodomus lindquistii]